MRARYYNPAVGRFTQEDTYRGDGLNLYAYCKNNPVVYYDPSGHDQLVNPSNGTEMTNTAGVGNDNLGTSRADVDSDCTSASKTGDYNKATQNFTREDIINSIDGVTEQSTKIADELRKKEIGLNVLGDEMFESYLGCSKNTIGMEVDGQIYVRRSSASLISDVVHEGTHAVEYRGGVDPIEISTWPGEKRAYEAERLFQIESGMPVTFEDVDEMMVHIYSKG